LGTFHRDLAKSGVWGVYWQGKIADCRVMVTRAFRLLMLLGAFASAGDLLAAGSWTKLKLGMTAGEAITTIGHPLMRMGKFGLEVWIYDNQAEILLSGSVIGWTCPSVGHQPGVSVDIWQSRGGNTGVIFAPANRMPAAPQAPRRETAVGREAGFRYRQ
jgi:hypothetical protein